MNKERKKSRKDRRFPLLLLIILVFAVLGTIVFSVVRRVSAEMSASAIQNLSESLNLIKCTIEAMLNNEAEFQKMMSREAARWENPEEYIRSFEKNQTIVKISLIRSGEKEGISSTGEIFTGDELDFSLGRTVNGLEISQSYINYMGTWAYSMKCPVIKEDREIGTLYAEYVYDSFDRTLPEGFYNDKAMLYIMDARTERFVLKPKGMGQRNAGHVNLMDFYRANDITEEALQEEVTECVQAGGNMLFYHDVQGKESLNYVWAANDGSIFLIGYVPIEAIQQEGRTVNQNIFLVVAVTLIAFFLCCVLYYFNHRRENRIRKERETEREIHNKQLAEALQAAQLASNSKTMFLSNMSHDIRTPMNAVLGFTTLLAKDAENPEKVREYTKKIMASGQHLLSLINDILDMSKIESGKVVLNIEEFTLSDLVSSVDAIIRPMANAKKQSLHVEVTGIRHEYLMGDETRINQILINLLSNAVKYTQEGGSIWFRIIGLKQRSGQYEHVRIEVEDNGYGMTQEYLKTIFDAFTRAENSTTNKVQGTGLGMAITKNIVELMGGTIDVSSQVDRGSLFRVELEFHIPEGHADKKFWEEHGISCILAVDSDEETCADIRTLMQDMGVVVDTVSDPQEALEMIRSSRQGEEYDLLLLEWSPSEGKDAQAAEQIREAVSDQVPLLFMTAVDVEEKEDIPRMENTGVLHKPFFVSALKDKIMEMRAESGEKEEQEETINLEGLRFLAAEDNEINAEILAEILDMEGAGCEIVENGRLAVERFERAEEGEFDAILMDVQMPVMNGYDAARAIRALKRSDAGRIPIIAMTANAFAEDEKEALDAGMDVHVAKPINVELLKRVIRECIRRQK